MQSQPESPLSQILSGEFTPARAGVPSHSGLRVVDWNIDRGLHLRAIIKFLKEFQADLILLQEVDVNARRTHHLDIAKEIAKDLRMNYVFGFEFQELTQGSAASPAYQGQATLSPWALRNARVIRFPRQSDFWRPHWYLPRHEPFQERLGGRIALCVEMRLPGRDLTTYNLHLESKGPDSLRLAQLSEVLRDAEKRPSRTPILVAGDLNLNAGKGAAATALAKAGFHDGVAEPGVPTRPARAFSGPRTIDWIFVNDRVRSREGQVHSVSGSDHYPVSLVVVRS
jgi:endonuclease/exonuclease/phosphatase family metal-dependent hydrolase